MLSAGLTSVIGLLEPSLEQVVPKLIAHLASRGGPTQADLAFARDFDSVLEDLGGYLSFRGKKRLGEAAEVFNGLARAMAVLAFAPGGVSFLDCHWEGAAKEERTS
jgi:hypothetical protein